MSRQHLLVCLAAMLGCLLMADAALQIVYDAQDLIDLFTDTPSFQMTDEIEVDGDLDFADTEFSTPLGLSVMECVPYSGVFNGQGHVIKNIAMDNTGNSDYPHAGLFCGLKGATIKDVTINTLCSFKGDSAGALSILYWDLFLW